MQRLSNENIRRFSNKLVTLPVRSEKVGLKLKKRDKVKEDL